MSTRLKSYISELASILLLATFKFRIENILIAVRISSASHNKAEIILIPNAADVKMEIPVLVRSLKSSILSSTIFQMSKTFWRVVSAAVEQSRRKAGMVAQGDGKFGP